MARKRGRAIDRLRTGAKAEVERLADYADAAIVLDSLKSHYRKHERELDNLAKVSFVSLHENKNFTVALFRPEPNGENYVGVTKRNNNDRYNYTIAKRICIYRAIEAYLKTLDEHRVARVLTLVPSVPKDVELYSKAALN